MKICENVKLMCWKSPYLSQGSLWIISREYHHKLL
jgi:hypothetical protein